jgi:hypothetical protein
LCIFELLHFFPIYQTKKTAVFDVTHLPEARDTSNSSVWQEKFHRHKPERASKHFTSWFVFTWSSDCFFKRIQFYNDMSVVSFCKRPSSLPVADEKRVYKTIPAIVPQQKGFRSFRPKSIRPHLKLNTFELKYTSVYHFKMFLIDFNLKNSNIRIFCV